MSKKAAGHLSHVDSEGRARMVDVGDKAVSRRSAVAHGKCVMNRATASAIRANTVSKGDVFQVARVAAILAAKRTDEMIPLCHTLPLERVDIDFSWLNECELEIVATTHCTGKTGVEIEAMVAVSTAALVIYDMCKSSDRAMRIETIELVRKTGGLHGDYELSESPGKSQ